MRKTIPNLRVEHNEFTLEHCSVLYAHLGKTLDQLYPNSDGGETMSEIADQANHQAMRDDLLTLMSAQQLSILFDTELGKGIILGMFYVKFVMPEMES